jgi:hypothetical protein
MSTNFYYVYSLKDPRTSPALPFYIGKGTGSRAYDHLVKPDTTTKYKLIKEIIDAGYSPIVAILVDDITESQAYKIEAELVSAFGTIGTGGLLTNSVIPSGLGGKIRINVTVPQGAVEKAQIGLSLIKDAVLDFIRANREGVTNSDIASLLGLRSDYRGKQKDYLSYSVLGLLLREGKINRESGSYKHKAIV